MKHTLTLPVCTVTYTDTLKHTLYPQEGRVPQLIQIPSEKETTNKKAGMLQSFQIRRER